MIRVRKLNLKSIPCSTSSKAHKHSVPNFKTKTFTNHMRSLETFQSNTYIKFVKRWIRYEEKTHTKESENIIFVNTILSFCSHTYPKLPLNYFTNESKRIYWTYRYVLRVSSERIILGLKKDAAGIIIILLTHSCENSYMLGYVIYIDETSRCFIIEVDDWTVN